MQFIHQMKCCHNCGSEIETRSDDGPIACRRLAKKEMIEIMIQIFSGISGLSPQQGSSSSSSEANFDLINLLGTVIEVMMIQKFPLLQIGRSVEDSSQVVRMRSQVRELIQPVLGKLQTTEQHISEAETVATTSVRTLQFVFLDEVSGPVLTSKEIKSIEDKSIRVKLIDRKTGDTVNLGFESSLRAEIVLLDASDDGNEKNWTFEDFLSRIIKEGDKTMPHFSKTQYIDLNEGVAVLRDIKLGHDKSWTKKSKCKLGVRLAGNIKGGVEVREAWTNSFEVRDSRRKQYEKGNPPCLSDPLWKLENIGRDGDPIKRLEKNNIKTVKDFLFLLSIDPMRLQNIFFGEKRKAKDSASNPKWDAIVKHAMTCRIDDTHTYVHFPHSESQRGVVFDIVGGLKGLIDKSHYICIDNLSEDGKDVARELLLSAFENQSDKILFRDETSLVERFPHPRNDIDIAANPVQEGHVSECNPSTYRLGDGDETTLLEQFPHPSNNAENQVQEDIAASVRECDLSTPQREGTFSLEQFTYPSIDVDVAANRDLEIIPSHVHEYNPSTYRLGYGDLTHSEQYYDDVARFGSSPGTMQVYEPICATPNQSQNWYFDIDPLWNFGDEYDPPPLPAKRRNPSQHRLPKMSLRLNEEIIRRWVSEAVSECINALIRADGHHGHKKQRIN